MEIRNGSSEDVVHLTCEIKRWGTSKCWAGCKHDDEKIINTAIITGVVDRFRPVLLTSLTTIGGLSALMFEKSLQAQFLIPMAATIVFGLGITAFLVLVIVPSMMGISNDLSNFIKNIRRS